jgi:Mrp family chromosome partitioning ATPase
MSEHGATELRTNIFAQLGADKPRTVLVAPFTVNDRATSVAIRLSKSLVAAGRKTTIVELPGADSTLCSHFDIPVSPGFADALRAGTIPRCLDDVGGVQGLSLVLAGSSGEDAEDLVASASAGDCLTQLKNSGLWTIVLSGTAANSSAALVLSHVCDGIVLVATHGHTNRVEAANLVAKMRTASIPILGVVLGPVED